MQRANEPESLVEVNVTYLFTTPMAIRVEDADGRKLWIPLKEISAGYDPDADRLDNMTLTVPEWLAVDRGLI